MNASEESKEKVLFFLDALNNEDYEAAKECLIPDFKFKGPLGKTQGAEEYLKQMRKIKFKYSIVKIFAHDDEVSVIYDIEMGCKDEITTCGLYLFKNGKIRSLKVFYDPRPVLQNAK
ncbi:nuclear transport factor 2 family protein [Aequorivita capsosiphonis]|uniref:nuclear transport factor 2 family protein n=1 Tax=Aequorivita capsosiphonis TaxID=487317 RepID=UPI0004184028|nr:nuclear transport factor 2 family protein [Aequorivita capsosiphonis]